LVLKDVGPKAYPGMPEVGNMGNPKQLLDKGVTDMVRISDGRRSGTAFGSVVLHASPEAAVGGLLGLVQDGDIIVLDVPNRRLAVQLSGEEVAERRNAWQPSVKVEERGYVHLYHQHVQQAYLGA